MFRYLIRRVLWALLLFIAVTLVTYLIFFVAPSNPARLVCGGQQAQPACIKRATENLGLNKPVIVQYGIFLEHLIVDRSLGTSFINRQSVNTVVAGAAPVTIGLVLGGMVLWLSIGLCVGIFSALRPRSLLDRSAMVFVLVGVSAHPIWIGLLASYIFGFRLGWFPITGYSDFFNPPEGTVGGAWPWFYHMLLPWLTFGVLGAALYVRMIRANVIETMNEDYVRTARSKGAPESQVMRAHILRNALLPIVTILGMDVGISLGGAIFTETVYSLPGLGHTAINAVGTYDLPVVQGVVVFATVAIISVNLLVDVLYAWVDPRIRLE